MDSLEFVNDLKDTLITYTSERGTFDATIYHYHTKEIDQLEKDLLELQKYKKLEEQIGCPFEIIAKAIKAGEVYIDSAYNCNVGEIYKIENEQYVSLRYIDNEEYKDAWCFEFEEVFDDFYKNPDAFIVKASDYKKTWWLKQDKSE